MSSNSRFRFLLSDAESEELLVDEDELLEVGLTIRSPDGQSAERKVQFRYDPELVNRLLREAGYEPSDVKKELRRAALDVVGCWQKGLGHDEDIAVCTGRRLEVVRAAAVALHSCRTPSLLLKCTKKNGESS